jgi:choline dehydrogenase-like flavoprotein
MSTPPTGTRWIASDLSHLYTLARESNAPLEFDVVIVGSGYGGAMAAAELAGLTAADGQEISVLVLERGKEYVPGMFPSSLQEMPGHVRVHRCLSGETTGWLDGLFDVRIGPDVCALVGNGLGGGSLINAGVMEVPDWTSVVRLPQTLKDALTPDALDRVKQRLGARAGGLDNVIPGDGTAKTQALRTLDPGHFRKAAVTVEFAQDTAGTPYQPCTRCGDCMTGCNVGAKKSLDTTLLLQARLRGARIHTGASVTGLARGALAPWELSVVFTDEGLRRRHEPLPVLAGKVILAAGTLGSPEILMRSQDQDLRFSPQLGQQFSCNGDNILAVQQTGAPTSMVAREDVPLDGREVGPTITGIVDVPRVDSGPAFLIQEFAVPAALKRVFDEIVTTFNMLHLLPTPDTEDHVGDLGGEDPQAVHQGIMAEALLLGLIGHDESCGQLTLAAVAPLDDNRTVEGRIHIAWPGARKSPLVDDAYARAEALIRDRWSTAPVLPNPLWRMLPEQMDFVFRTERGPLLTVHPLGGCPIGPNPHEGVVDEWGRVYDFAFPPGPGLFHDGLYVLDGSIVPASLGANPALTIAAIAERAAARIAADAGWRQAADGGAAPARPRARELNQCTPPPPAPTEVELIEKLCGPVQLQGGDYMAELTLRYVPHALDRLATDMRRELVVAQTPGVPSTLRLYKRDVWNDKGIRFMEEPARARHAELVAPVTGKLSLLQREPSWRWWRVLRGIWAYLWNRGLRDLWSSWAQIWKHRGQIDRLLALASRAGEVRRFDYTMQIGAASGPNQQLLTLAASHPQFRGSKRFTYSVRGNPWRQLMELHLSGFLGATTHPMLELDGRFMARQAVPLARIVAQENQVHALADSASFALYFLRLIVNIHVWSFRAPDPMPPRQPVLLPGPIAGVPEPPVVIEIELEPPRHGIAVRVRLTRYKGSHADDPADGKVPLVMIHGYSASGTTFTHDAIPEPMARYFWNQGRDVWILDLRTSAGMASAVLPWNFEDVALADIPVAIQRIREITGKDQVDVFAHCIGAVMLSMALLTDGSAEQMAQIDDVDVADGIRPVRYIELVKTLPASIRRIVLSQKGPALVYSDGNVLRAYLMRVLRRLILPQDYQFRAPAQQVLAGQALDRLLSSMPYPDDELARENPHWPCAKTPWVGFRHRMDALYARDFSLRNISDDTLAALEDLFGPLNLDTVAQAVHFARYNRITNGAGRNCFVTVTRMQSRWPTEKTMSIHGEENGLADVRTVTEMQRLMKESERESSFFPLVIAGLGHQDCLVGTSARDKVFAPIEEFLR